MNRIIAKEMLAGALPEDLRGDIDPAHRVLVTVAEVRAASDVDDAPHGDKPYETYRQAMARYFPDPAPHVAAGSDDAERPPRTLSELLAARPPGTITIDEAVARVRALRDEWDD